MDGAVKEKIIVDDFTDGAIISGTDNIKSDEEKFLSYKDTQRVVQYFKNELTKVFRKTIS